MRRSDRQGLWVANAAIALTFASPLLAQSVSSPKGKDVGVVQQDADKERKQTPPGQTPVNPPKPQPSNEPNLSNGIGVGMFKIYDERLLTNMLLQLEAQLAAINAINGGNVTAGLGRTAGAQISTSQIGLSINGLPTADRSVVDTVKTGGDQSAESSMGSTVNTGKEPSTQEASSNKTIDKSTDSTETATTTKTPSAVPQAATLPQASNVYKDGPAVSLAAQNLLVEQVNLSAQVMNLRLLLTRAVSDRFLILGKPGESKVTGARAQAVVGLRIAIDAMRTYRNAVAEVEIRLGKSNPVGCELRNVEAPGLTLVLPREKSYNVATITKNATSIGFGAIVQIVNVGFSMSRARETMYMVQDYDTVALERSSPAASETIFAWQFRPTLGRSAVEPGQRDVFALLSLPADAKCDVSTRFEIRSYWRRYDKKSGTVGDVIDDSTTSVKRGTLEIPAWRAQENALRPKITDAINWVDAGSGAVLGWLEGEAYLPGTQIVVGDKILSPGEGSVVVQSDARLRFTVSGVKLAQAGDAMLVSNFGIPTAVRSPDRKDATNALVVDGFAVAGATYEVTDADRVQVKIELVPRNPAIAYNADRPVVLIGDRLFGLSNAPLAVLNNTGLDGAKLGSTLLQFRALADVVKNAEKARILEFFKGPSFMAETRLTGKAGFTVMKADVLSKGNTDTTIGLTGTSLTQDVSVEINGKTFKPGQGQTRLVGTTLLMLTVGNADVVAAKRFLIVKPGSPPIILSPPGGGSQPATPDGAVQETVHVNDSIWVVIKGTGLDEVTTISFEAAVQLEFEKGPTDDTLRVRLTQYVTKTEGTKDLLLKTRAGKAGVVRFKVSKQ